MNVSEVIEELRKYPPDAEVHICTDDSHASNTTSEVESIFESTATYGILLPDPTTVKTVVLDVRMCGL